MRRIPIDPESRAVLRSLHQEGVEALAGLLRGGADAGTVLAAAVVFLDRFAASIGDHLIQVGEMRSATMLHRALEAAGFSTEYVPQPPDTPSGPDPDLDLHLGIKSFELFDESDLKPQSRRAK